MAGLRERGVSLQAVRRAAAFLHRHCAELVRPLASLTFITDGKRIFALTEDPRRVVDLTARGQIVMAVSLGSLVSELREKVAALSAPRELIVRVRGVDYRAILAPDLERGGYSIEIPQLPGCFTEADNLSHARRMVREAIDLMLSEESPSLHSAESISR